MAIVALCLLLWGCGAIKKMQDEVAAHEATVGKVQTSNVKVLSFNRPKGEVKGPIKGPGYRYYWVNPGPTDVVFTLRFGEEYTLGCPFGKKCIRTITLKDSTLKISFTAEAGHVYRLQGIVPPEWRRKARSGIFKSIKDTFTGNWSAKLVDRTDRSNELVLSMVSSGPQLASSDNKIKNEKPKNKSPVISKLAGMGIQLNGTIRLHLIDGDFITVLETEQRPFVLHVTSESKLPNGMMQKNGDILWKMGESVSVKGYLTGGTGTIWNPVAKKRGKAPIVVVLSLERL